VATLTETIAEELLDSLNDPDGIERVMTQHRGPQIAIDRQTESPLIFRQGAFSFLILWCRRSGVTTVKSWAKRCAI